MQVAELMVKTRNLGKKLFAVANLNILHADWEISKLGYPVDSPTYKILWLQINE